MPPASIKSSVSTLLEALRSAQDTDSKFFSPHRSSIALDRSDAILAPSFDLVSEKIDKWFQSVGLTVNPFVALDASQDPFIPFYLIDHNQFNTINGDFISFVFAPPGCGKSAFRVRLARDCRVGKDGRKIFPIVYNLPVFDSLKISSGIHYEALARSAALELLLYVLYHPSLFVNNEDLLIEIQHVFDNNFFINYIQQMVEVGSIQPLLDAFDRTANFLPNPPKENDMSLLAKKLQSHRLPHFSAYKMSPKERLDQVLSLVIKKLGYESVYILVDGVDGYFETGTNADTAVDAIDWLLRQSGEWQNNRIYIKYFLPSDVQPALEGRFPLLTSESKIVGISWNVDSLSEVIRQRLQEASDGKYSSLRAISTLHLRGARQAPEDVLAHEIAKLGDLTPRKIIKAINRLLIHHIQNDYQEKITPDDLKAAIDWIRSERSIKTTRA